MGLADECPYSGRLLLLHFGFGVGDAGGLALA